MLMISMESQVGQALHSAPTQMVAFIDTCGHVTKTEREGMSPLQSKTGISHDHQREVEKVLILQFLKGGREGKLKELVSGGLICGVKT